MIYIHFKDYISSESNRLGYNETLGVSLCSSPKIARRDTSIKSSIPNCRAMKELIESGKKGNIDDSCLTKEVCSILNSQGKDLRSINDSTNSSVYEMYMPFIRGHYDNTIEIPKTSLCRWIKKVGLGFKCN